MVNRKAEKSFEEVVAESFNEDLQKVAEQLAAEAGNPPGADKISEAESVRLFGLRDPSVDYQQLAMRLMGGGLPPEEVAQLTIVQERPEWAELYMQPAPDFETADLLARLAEYPYRPGLVLDHSDDPEEQTKRSEQLHAAWLKTLPPPLPPMPEFPMSTPQQQSAPMAGPPDVPLGVPTGVPSPAPMAAPQPAPMQPPQPAPPMPTMIGG
jgi:hypothetical protein